MSRVHSKQKYMNTNYYSSKITGSSKTIRSKGENADYTKARSLTDWLFLKYDMSYKAYKKKSTQRRQELRAEYQKDTNRPLPPDVSFAAYLSKYGKTVEDISSLRKEIQDAWFDEYNAWKETEILHYRERLRWANMTKEDIEIETALDIYRAMNVPIVNDEPLGV